MRDLHPLESAAFARRTPISVKRSRRESCILQRLLDGDEHRTVQLELAMGLLQLLENAPHETHGA